MGSASSEEACEWAVMSCQWCHMLAVQQEARRSCFRSSRERQGVARSCVEPLMAPRVRVDMADNDRQESSWSNDTTNNCLKSHMVFPITAQVTLEVVWRGRGLRRPVRGIEGALGEPQWLQPL